jgi:hypothetical protein
VGTPPRARRGEGDRGLRGLVGAGSSQVGVQGAMRARDAARPTPLDVAAAERELVIVRRHYTPPDVRAEPARDEAGQPGSSAPPSTAASAGSDDPVTS